MSDRGQFSANRVVERILVSLVCIILVGFVLTLVMANWPGVPAPLPH